MTSRSATPDGPAAGRGRVRRARAPLAFGAALLLIGLNTRLSLAGIPTVLDDLRADLRLSRTTAGLLTTVPVLCFGLVAPLAPRLARRTGAEAALLGCMVALAAGIALRLAPATGPLFAGTVVAGVAIAVTNVLMPAIIKRDFERPGVMMAVYSTSLSVSAALAAGLTVPLEGALGSWRWALAAAAVPALVAAIAWLPAVSARDGVLVNPPPAVRLWRSATAWLVTGTFAVQSTLFYITIAWMPDILRDEGMSAGAAGGMLSIAMLLGVPTSMVVPILAGRLDDQRLLLVGATGLWVAGLTGVLVSPDSGAAAWMVLIGLGQGAGISLALMLFVIRTPDGEHAAALSGMAQTVGYAAAAVGPLAIGALHEATHGWHTPMAVMLGACGALLAFGLGAARPGMARAAPRDD
jgi:CP family cyanate transporter-like MFS transporter